MHEARGIGLAAQQVGRAIQLCVVDLRGTEAEFEWELDGAEPPLELFMPLVLVNPKISPLPKTPDDTAEEGCLSFPEIRGDVARPDGILVKFKDERGTPHVLLCNGLLARCVQHEADHLNGVLFIDRMEKKVRAGLDLAVKALAKQTRQAKPAAPNMTQKADGMNYAPQGKPNPVVQTGEFGFAAAHLDHGHIYGQCNGLIEAGADLRWVYDPDPAKVAAFVEKFPGVRVARSLDEILADGGVKLLAAAAVPSERCALGIRAMEAGKDYFTDKTPFTTLEQLDLAKAAVQRTARKYMVYFSERLHVESAMFATELVQSGAIGRVVHVLGLGPHRLNQPSRPAWFFKKAQYGGILCDIGSHQFEQFLTFAGATDATVTHAAIANFNHPDVPEFEDFGEATLLGNNGATNFVRVDWFTPAGLSTWGDGRMVILGTKGYIELRKYVDVGRDKAGDNVYIVDDQGERRLNVTGQVGFPFFGRLILDCLNRTELAMTQAHAFKAAELCLKAQQAARRIE